MVSPAQIATIILAAAQAMDLAVKVGQDIGPQIAAFKKIFGKEEITDQDLNELAAHNTALYSRLQKRASEA